MDPKYLQIVAVIDAVLGVTIFIVCFCRAVVSNQNVLRRVRLKFVLLGPSSLAFGLSPLWGDWPGWINPILLGAITVGLFAETFQWKKGPPANVCTDSIKAPLDEDTP